MKKRDLLKMIFSGIISIGVGSIVNNLSEYFVPKNIKSIAKVGIGLSTFVATNLITNKLSTTVETEIDNVIEDKGEIIEEGV